MDASVVTEVALACRTSQYAAWQRLRAADALITDARLPRTAALLEAGLLDWAKVAEMVRGTADLPAAAATAVEARVADRLLETNVPTLRRALTAAVAAVDAQAHQDRSVHERERRSVTTRPGSEPLDGMGHIEVYAPLDAVAAVAATLDAAVASARAAGDPRSAGEVRCDELVSRVTGGAWTGSVAALAGPGLTRGEA